MHQECFYGIAFMLVSIALAFSEWVAAGGLDVDTPRFH